jgi:hypothetical protein
VQYRKKHNENSILTLSKNINVAHDVANQSNKLSIELE